MPTLKLLRAPIGLALFALLTLPITLPSAAQDRKPPGASRGAGAQQKRELPRWAPSIEAGLAEAKKRGVALLVALNMDNERGNQGMVDDVYTSAEFHAAAAKCVIAVGSLSKHPTRTDPKTGKKVCARFGSILCAEHQDIEATVRQDWLKRGPKDDVESPRHFFLSPDGKILFEKVWTMKAGDLSALMMRASELCTPDNLKDWDELAGRLRRAQDPIAAVREIALAELIAENSQEIDTELAKLAKSTKDANVAGSIYAAFATASDPLRRKFAQTALSSKAPEVRMIVAYAMHKSGVAEHLKPLLARVSKEKDERVRGTLYRAIGALGKDDAAVRKVLLKSVQNSKDAARGHAALSIGPWATEKKVQAALKKILVQGGRGRVRGAAVFALGMSKSDKCRDAVKTFREGLSRWDWRTKKTCDAALKNLKGEGTPGYEKRADSILKNPAEGEEEEDKWGGGRGR